MTELLLLCAFSMAAGFVDAVVGGGGLIQLPAALLLMPGVPYPVLLGTNKFASLFGTTIAVQRYARHVQIDWRTVGPAAGAAFLFAFLGSRMVTLLDPALLRPLVLGLLILVAIYVFFVKELGLVHKPKHAPRKARLLGILVGALLGFYDGFFGPGTGSFLIFAFVGLFGFNFLSASASAKTVNLSTNSRVAHLLLRHRQHPLWRRPRDGGVEHRRRVARHPARDCERQPICARLLSADRLRPDREARADDVDWLTRTLLTSARARDNSPYHQIADTTAE
jgi:uncharacterized membrane protein YfcA